MHGQIIKFREDLGFGVIKADDGSKYRFSKAEIVNLNGHLIGENVDFLIQNRAPKAIFVMAGSPWSAFGAKRAA